MKLFTANKKSILYHRKKDGISREQNILAGSKENNMKKTIMIILAAALLLALTACGGREILETEPTAGTVPVQTEPTETEAAGEKTFGQLLLASYKEKLAANPDMSALELAEAVVTDPAVLFDGTAMEIEPGFLTGFGDLEITGFSEGAMFGPYIGTIPFVGYVFRLPDGADEAAFVSMLKDNANPRWNICTEAEETVVETVDGTVFFLMCPRSAEG